jgi:hypothetical protein
MCARVLKGNPQTGRVTRSVSVPNIGQEVPHKCDSPDMNRLPCQSLHQALGPVQEDNLEMKCLQADSTLCHNKHKARARTASRGRAGAKHTTTNQVPAENSRSVSQRGAEEQTSTHRRKTVAHSREAWGGHPSMVCRSCAGSPNRTPPEEHHRHGPTFLLSHHPINNINRSEGLHHKDDMRQSRVQSRVRNTEPPGLEGACLLASYVRLIHATSHAPRRKSRTNSQDGQTELFCEQRPKAKDEVSGSEETVTGSDWSKNECVPVLSSPRTGEDTRLPRGKDAWSNGTTSCVPGPLVRGVSREERRLSERHPPSLVGRTRVEQCALAVPRKGGENSDLSVIQRPRATTRDDHGVGTGRIPCLPSRN